MGVGKVLCFQELSIGGIIGYIGDDMENTREENLNDADKFVEKCIESGECYCDVCFDGDAGSARGRCRAQRGRFDYDGLPPVRQRRPTHQGRIRPPSSRGTAVPRRSRCSPSPERTG